MACSGYSIIVTTATVAATATPATLTATAAVTVAAPITPATLAAPAVFSRPVAIAPAEAELTRRLAHRRPSWVWPVVHRRVRSGQ